MTFSGFLTLMLASLGLTPSVDAECVAVPTADGTTTCLEAPPAPPEEQAEEATATAPSGGFRPTRGVTTDISNGF